MSESTASKLPGETSDPSSPSKRRTRPRSKRVQSQPLAPVVHLPVPAPTYITVHGHFYQPPRENPWLNTIDRQPSAAPFQNWNERILSECYRPNAFARILDDQGNVLQIVNNYEYLSFNFGPTLLSWIERHDIEVYQRILAADRLSAQRLDGHGNGIAQVYNHIILPLATARDKQTQIRWGIADFQHRFGRQPEGMWLAETAIDQETVAALVKEKIKFVILAPSQAERIRSFESDAWQDVGGSEIDPTQPYRCFLPDRTQYLDIFFYDGPISRDLGFGDMVYNSHHLKARLQAAIPAPSNRTPLVHCASDGETFGHHKKGVERTLAYAFTHEFPEQGWVVTNYAHYLSLYPPTWEVELKPATAWSCAHGVGRWSQDCGCGGGGGWHQQWRQPLRESLDWLRDQLAALYLNLAKTCLKDPWEARDHYIDVILDREQRASFLRQHQRHPLSPLEQTQTLQLLEMQRYSQLMFTSCGWFFEELSRPEGVQILRYAAKAIELATEVAGVDLEPEFRDRLALAPSNLAQFEHGEGVYRQLVLPSMVRPMQIAAQYAMSSIFNETYRQTELYGYTLEQLDRDRRYWGGTTLAVGWIQLESAVTHEKYDLVYAVLHLGGWDFQCGIQAFPGRRGYEDLKRRLLGGSRLFNRTELVIAIQELFNHTTYNLNHVLGEERQRMMQRLTQDTLQQLSQLYRQTFLENYTVMQAFRADGLPIPPELQAAAQIALNQRLVSCLWRMETDETGSDPVQEMRVIAQEAEQFGCQLHWGDAAKSLDRLLHRCLWQMVNGFDPQAFADQLHRLEQLTDLAYDLDLPIQIDHLQELYLSCLESQIAPRCTAWPTQACQEISTPHLIQLLKLSQPLRVNVSHWKQPVSI